MVKDKLKKILNEAESEWITVQTVLTKLGSKLKDDSKKIEVIEKEIIKVMEEELKNIDTKKLIEIESIIDKELVTNIKSNYLFNVQTLLTIIKEVEEVLLKNNI